MEGLEEAISQIKKELDETYEKFGFLKYQKEYDEIEQERSAKGFWNMNVPEEREKMDQWNSLQQKIQAIERIKANLSNLRTVEELLSQEQDRELETEAEQLIQKLNNGLKQLRTQLMWNDEEDNKNVIMTLHAGAGGTEACDWVSMIWRMYSRWVAKKGFTVKPVDFLPGEEAGLKSITVMISGKNAYGYLKGENGVHRLVRISPFDTNKRRHTSFAAASIIPEIEKDDKIQIKEEDLVIETFRAGGHGGQNVNKLETAVRMRHIPTGTVVHCQNERSQLKNRQIALKIMKSKLYQLQCEEERKEEVEKRIEQKKIEWGSQIRSYVFCPYTLVKDHRTGVEVGNVQAVMDGEIDKFIEAEIEWLASNKNQ